MPARVAIKAGTRTLAIQKPWNTPTARPMASMTTTAIGQVLYQFLPPVMITQPTAAVKQTTEPTDRSMLPPVRMHSSIPDARTNT